MLLSRRQANQKLPAFQSNFQIFAIPPSKRVRGRPENYTRQEAIRIIREENAEYKRKQPFTERDSPDLGGTELQFDEFGGGGGGFVSGGEEGDDEKDLEEIEDQLERRRKPMPERRLRAHAEAERALAARWESATPQNSKVYTARKLDSRWVIGAPHQAVQGSPAYEITLIDLRGVESTTIYPGTVPITDFLLDHCYLSASPKKPKVAFALDFLELMANLQTNMPGATPHGMMKTHSVLSNTAFDPGYYRKFLEALTAYRAILKYNKRELQQLLGRDDHRGHSLCVLCQYQLANEDPLVPLVQVAIDGNFSNKRLDPKLSYPERVYQSDHKLDPAHVNLFDFTEKRSKDKSLNDLCTDNWKAADPSAARQPFKHLAESGEFSAVCRHGVLIISADMIKSGEKSKYPLALIDYITKHFADTALIGYDIGCRFQSTYLRSWDLLENKRIAAIDLSTPLDSAERNRRLPPSHEFVVGAWHGYAHNRECQLEYHPRQKEGAGMEDFEGTERFWSKTNPCASSTRHCSSASRSLRLEVEHDSWNREKQIGAADWILARTKLTNKTIKDAAEFEAIRAQMPEHARTDADLFKWAAERQEEELRYLQKRLTNTQVAEVEEFKVRFAYKDNLDKLLDHKQRLDLELQSQTPSIEQLSYLPMAIQAVNLVLRDIEEQLNITDAGQRWTPNSPEYTEVAVRMEKEKYVEASKALQRAVLARQMEMAKLNQPGTGYATRQKIAGGVSSRSANLRKALEARNLAGIDHGIPALTWKQIQSDEYITDHFLQIGFVGPAGVNFMNFETRKSTLVIQKMQRAREEIRRLQIEANRLWSWSHHEKDWFASLKTEATKQPNFKKPHRYQLFKEESARKAKIFHATIFTLNKLTKYHGFGNFVIQPRKDNSRGWTSSNIRVWEMQVADAMDTDDSDSPDAGEGRGADDGNDGEEYVEDVTAFDPRGGGDPETEEVSYLFEAFSIDQDQRRLEKRAAMTGTISSDSEVGF